MRWPWSRHDDGPRHEVDPAGIDEAAETLDGALALWPEVRSVTEQIRGIRRRNHLAEITERALRGSR